VPIAEPRHAPNGMALGNAGRLIDTAPHDGGQPASEASPATVSESLGDGEADDEKNKRLRDIVIAVAGNDTRFARAILDPQPIDMLGGLPDPAKQ